MVSAGCQRCYAQKQAGTCLASSAKYRGLTLGSNAGPVWTGEVRLWEPALIQPLQWVKPRQILVNSMSDLFHENVPDEWIDEIFAVIGSCDDVGLRHIFQILTKRSDRQRDYMRSERAIKAWNRRRIARNAWPPRNIWAGVSAEDQLWWDDRAEHLAQTPAVVRWVSLEPLLSAIDAAPMLGMPQGPDWVVVGGETGSCARSFSVEWARSIIAQCKDAGVPVFIKQLGSNPREGTGFPLDDARNRPVGSASAPGFLMRLHDRKGADPAEWPPDIRVREYPTVRVSCHRS